MVSGHETLDLSPTPLESVSASETAGDGGVLCRVLSAPEGGRSAATPAAPPSTDIGLA